MGEFLNRLWRAKGLWLRVLFCWMLGSTFPFFDEVKDYDLRFGIRGTQDTIKQIVIVEFDQEDWVTLYGSNNNLLRSVKEFSEVTDSYFWRAKMWDNLLEKILQQEPQAIGVSFFFNDNLPRPDESLKSLFDPRVIWAGQLDSDGRPMLPVVSSSYGYNVALVDMREDQDRILRRFASPLNPLPHMGLKLAERNLLTPHHDLNSLLGETRLLNFRGPRQVFPSVNALAILKGRIPPNFFKQKIVIIGSRSMPSHLFETPLGPMSRSEVMAQVIDNVIGKRWITRLSPWLSSVYLLLVLLISVYILTTYPQSVAFVFLLWLGLGTTALSLWVFDAFYYWIPAFSCLFLILMTYIVFLGYQLSIKENQTWRLEQEKSLLSELDQLRNNFVSLISHDLKTPIAKIQAICDRLLAGSVTDEIKEGLGSLRKESMELHRYIQSILQISRLESSQMQVRKEATDLNEIIENVVAQVRPLLEDKRQVLRLELEPMFSIEVDGLMVQEVILNLIENAIKYTPNDGLIQVKTREVDDKVVFSVTDNGPGIPSADRERIFEKFFRGQAQKSQIKGTGLGLFLVKYFIEMHGGEVFLESAVGKGTRVGFTLPLA